MGSLNPPGVQIYNLYELVNFEQIVQCKPLISFSFAHKTRITSLIKKC